MLIEETGERPRGKAGDSGTGPCSQLAAQRGSLAGHAAGLAKRDTVLCKQRTHQSFFGVSQLHGWHVAGGPLAVLLSGCSHSASLEPSSPLSRLQVTSKGLREALQMSSSVGDLGVPTDTE